MKNNRKNLILGIMLFLFCGACKQYEDNTYTTEIFRYVNESGVQVALVGETPQGYFDIPDSLVLQNGASYECLCSSPDMEGSEYSSFPYKSYIPDVIPIVYLPLKIYFNKTICMTYYDNEENRDLRNPFYYGLRNPALGIGTPSYVKTTRKEKHKPLIETINTYTYTFTAADYQNALKAQE